MSFVARNRAKSRRPCKLEKYLSYFLEGNAKLRKLLQDIENKCFRLFSPLLYQLSYPAKKRKDYFARPSLNGKLISNGRPARATPRDKNMKKFLVMFLVLLLVGGVVIFGGFVPVGMRHVPLAVTFKLTDPDYNPLPGVPIRVGIRLRQGLAETRRGLSVCD